jgi:hypothetical protein
MAIHRRLLLQRLFYRPVCASKRKSRTAPMVSAAKFNGEYTTNPFSRLARYWAISAAARGFA